jgi:hypothetical protein
MDGAERSTTEPLTSERWRPADRVFGVLPNYGTAEDATAV